MKDKRGHGSNKKDKLRAASASRYVQPKTFQKSGKQQLMSELRNDHRGNVFSNNVERSQFRPSQRPRGKTK
jgi:hypothetical protein